MMNDVSKNLAFELLKALDMVMLLRVGPMRYEIYGKVPTFYADLFPSPDDTASVCPWEHSLMLESFIVECEEYFESDHQPSISSGVWLEKNENSNEELPLTAVGWKFGKEQLLVIQCTREEYAERAHILRKARSVLLDRRRISTAMTRFRKQALYDPLTQIYNRTAFKELLEEQITKVDEYPESISLLMIDIDNFKLINDTFGHLAGDSVLSQMGKLLIDSLRKGDAPVRYGGEEFAVLASQSNLLQIYRVAEKLRHRIASHDFGLGVPVTVSIGGTLHYHPEETAKEFIHRADLALYDAKRQGKNTVCLRNPWTGKIMTSRDFDSDQKGYF